LTKISEYPPGTPSQTINLSQPPPVEFPTALVVSAGLSPEIVVYAADVPDSALFELDKSDDPASPGGKLIDLLNNGNELNPPPQNDPHVTFQVKVQSGIPYRCWIHMKVGEAQGSSQANVIWVQLSNALDAANQEILKPGTGSYLTARGPAEPGWTWVSCNQSSQSPGSMIHFNTNGGDRRSRAGGHGRSCLRPIPPESHEISGVSAARSNRAEISAITCNLQLSNQSSAPENQIRVRFWRELLPSSAITSRCFSWVHASRRGCRVFCRRPVLMFRSTAAYTSRFFRQADSCSRISSTGATRTA
jgi:hypothetical protein